jgi:tetratricopeptide (TPR) repeat protein
MTLMKLVGVVLCVGWAMGPVAWAEIVVERTAGVPVVRVMADKVAVWQDGDGVVVVAAGAGDVQGVGAGASVVSVRGGHGVRVAGKGPWQVRKGEEAWLVRPGDAKVRQANVQVLRDGVQVPAAAKLEVTLQGETQTVWAVPQTVGMAAGMKELPVTLVGVRAAAAGVSLAKVNEGVALAGKHVADAGVKLPKEAKAPALKTAQANTEKLPNLPAVAQPMVSVDEMLAGVMPAAGPTEKGVSTTRLKPMVVPVRIGVMYQPGAVQPLAPELLAAWQQTQQSTLEMQERAGAVSPTSWLDGAVQEAQSMGVSATLPPAVQGPVLPMGKVAEVLDKGGEDYATALNDAWGVLAESPETGRDAAVTRRALAGFYLAWQRPEEALGVLGLLPVRNDGKPADELARLLGGMATLLRGDALADNAIKAWFDQNDDLAKHAKLWRAVAWHKQGEHARALDVWPQEKGVLPEYPAWMREQVLVAQADALVQAGDPAVARKVVDDLQASYASATTATPVPVAVLRLAGVVRLGTADEQAGLELLAQAAADGPGDAEQRAWAKYTFVRALKQREDLTDAQYRDYLADLALDWRGDVLERTVLRQLAAVELKLEDPRSALGHWQQLVESFPTMPDMPDVTQQMRAAVLQVFDQENPNPPDVLTLLGLYYDFRELIPNDPAGDQIHARVAQLLTDTGLWDRAVAVLEGQLNFRPLPPVEQGRLALQLAQVHVAAGRPEQALQVLDTWRGQAVNTLLRQRWSLTEAQALLALNRPTDVAQALKDLPDEPEIQVQAQRLRLEAAAAMQDWPNVVADVQPRLPASLNPSDTLAQLKVLQLATAYGALKDAQGLDALQKKYQADWPALPQLADGVGAVAASSGVSASVPGVGPLASLTGALAEANALADQIVSSRLRLKQQAAEREEYNAKMQYMELLPPPVL